MRSHFVCSVLQILTGGKTETVLSILDAFQMEVEVRDGANTGGIFNCVFFFFLMGE